MDVLIQIALAVALIAAMIGLRMFSSRAIFNFRMNNGFRAHECDGTCHSHGKAEAAGPETQNRT